MPRRKWHVILPLFVLVANVLDLAMTLIALNCTNAFQEANPIMAYLFDHHGMFAASVFKMTVAGLVCWLIWWAMEREQKLSGKIWFRILVTGPYCLLLLYWGACWFFYFLTRGA